MKNLTDGAWLLALGNANAILLRDGDDLVLFDAGFPGKEQVVFDAIEKLGRRRSDLKHMIFTHGHPDHIGSAAAIVRETGATTWMHAADAPYAASGGPFRPMKRAPGLMHALIFKVVWRPEELMQPFGIDKHMVDGDVLPVAGGLQVIGTPGHCAGQVALLWRGEQLLIGGDVFMNMFGIADPIGFEDEAEGRRSQNKLASLSFDVAAFGHGGAITQTASSTSWAYRRQPVALVPTVLGPIFVDDKGSIDEPVTMLWPSLFTDHRMWDSQVAVLRDAGWRTLALDPPGHGQSSGPKGNFTMDQCAEAALQILDALEVRTPIMALGTSWGGFVVPRMALRAPGRVGGMILFNTSAELPLAWQRVNGSIAATLLSIRLLKGYADRLVIGSMLAADTKRQRPNLERDLALQTATWERERLVASVRSVLLDRDASLDLLSGITCPTLVVSGGKDKILPSVLGRRMASKLLRARHTEIPAAGHLAPLETPDAANALILEFIRSAVLPSSPKLGEEPSRAPAEP